MVRETASMVRETASMVRETASMVRETASMVRETASMARENARDFQRCWCSMTAQRQYMPCCWLLGYRKLWLPFNLSPSNGPIRGVLRYWTIPSQITTQ